MANNDDHGDLDYDDLLVSHYDHNHDDDHCDDDDDDDHAASEEWRLLE